MVAVVVLELVVAVWSFKLFDHRELPLQDKNLNQLDLINSK